METLQRLPRRDVRFVNAELEPMEADQWTARVELSRAGAVRYVGTRKGVRAAPDREGLRLVAEATAQALVRAAGRDDHGLEVHGIEWIEVFSRRGVVVYLRGRYKEHEQNLMGFSVADLNPTRAAALAVLNAVNRFFGVG
jgi:hypothetical protein